VLNSGLHRLVFPNRAHRQHGSVSTALVVQTFSPLPPKNVLQKSC
jgi:hypothetical protein